MAAAVLSLLAAESERAPVLVLVDDLQWVDRESAAALAFAARRLREDPVCFVWAARSGSIPPEFVQGMPVLTLAGLSRADARALVPDRVADRVVERLVEDTGGNPLGILEIAGRLTDAQRVGAAPLPDALPVGDRLGVVYEQQLTGLSAPARRAVLLSALNRSATSAHGGRGAGPRGGRRCRRIGRSPGPRRTGASRRGDWLPPSAAAYVGAGFSDFGRNNGQHIGHWRMFSPAIHTRSPGPGTEPKPPPARTSSSRRTWCAQRIRAAPGRGTPPHLPRWSGLRCSWTTLH